MTRENISAHELTGLHVTVTHSSDPTQRGISGTVVDESKNMLKMLGAKGAISIPKNTTEFTFTLQNGERATVKGTRLRLRPEDRIKRGIGIWR